MVQRKNCLIVSVLLNNVATYTAPVGAYLKFAVVDELLFSLSEENVILLLG